jgi:HEAT repeat protein
MLHRCSCLIVISSLLVLLVSTGDRCACAEPKADQDAALSRRIDELIRKLGARQFAERDRAARDLIDIGAPALEGLRKAATDADAEIAGRSTKCIAAIELNIKVATLAAALQDKDPRVRFNAADGLMELRESARAAVPALIRALDDADQKVLYRVIGALGHIGPDAKPAVPKLIAMLEDTQANDLLRFYAASCLGQIGPEAERAVPVLLRLLAPKVPKTVRYGVVTALGGIGAPDERVVPTLLKLLDDPDRNIHINAAGALGQIGKSPAKVVPALLEMLKNNSRGQSDKDDDRAQHRRTAVTALQRFGLNAEPAVPLLTEIAKDELEQVDTRWLAIEALGRVGPKAQAAVPALESVAQDPGHGGTYLGTAATRALKAITRSEK